MDFKAKRDEVGIERRKKAGIRSMGDLKRSGKVTGKMNPALFVHGPVEFDLLYNKWSRQEVLGIVGDSSSGKSEVALYAMKHILESQLQSVAIYVSLEMTDEKISSRFYQMCQGNDELADRFYVISRYDEEGKAKNVSMGWIKKEIQRYKEELGDVSVYAIDHIHCLGENDPSTLNSMMIVLKEMAVSLNCLGIALAQVNKGSGQKGEVPLDADSVLACSQFKYIASDIIQIHRPIARFEDHAGFSVLGYGYCKIREAHPEDKIKKLQNKLLVYVPETRSFRKMDNGEVTIFKQYYNELLAQKSAEEKNKAYAYDISKEIIGSNGKTVTIKEVFSGDVD
jgi:ABC-type dipeptide/oligopeptide/nickel transport system ATPase component